MRQRRPPPAPPARRERRGAAGRPARGPTALRAPRPAPPAARRWRRRSGGSRGTSAASTQAQRLLGLAGVAHGDDEGRGPHPRGQLVAAHDRRRHVEPAGGRQHELAADRRAAHAADGDAVGPRRRRRRGLAAQRPPGRVVAFHELPAEPGDRAGHAGAIELGDPLGTEPGEGVNVEREARGRRVVSRGDLRPRPSRESLQTPITESTRSRFSSMSSRVSAPRLRRSRGSVLEGRTLKCQRS